MTTPYSKLALVAAIMITPTVVAAQQPPATPPAPVPPAATPPPATTPPAAVPSTTSPATAAPATPVPPVSVQQPAPPRVTPPPVRQAAPRATPAPAPAPRPAAAAPPPTPPAPPVEAALPAPGGEVKLSPVGGSIPVAKYPGSVSTITPSDITRGGEANPANALQQSVPGVVLTDASGNAFLQEINFRGFTSSGINGTPQGLAVYQNGTRINEVFGDTVNWDLIPSNAISDLTLLTGNPVYGLNAIGGAIAITMKDGFQFQGVEIDARFGSFGRRQVGAQAGHKFSPNFAAYAAFENIKDDGWRDRSASSLRRAYGDLAYKDARQEYHLSITGGKSTLGATAATPIELVNERLGAIFTSPQITENQVAMLQFNGQYALARTTKLSANAYVRKFKQRRIDGNLTEVEECDPAEIPPIAPGVNALCFEEDDNSLNGGTIAFDPTRFYGALDRTGIDSTSGGGSLQLTETSKLFGLGNQFIVGASLDYGRSRSRGESELGTVGSDLVVTGDGTILRDDEEGAIQPFLARVRTEYWGFYVADTLDLTSRLALTLGGRYNIAKIELKDGVGDFPELAGSHRYERFNPSAGLAYKITPNVSIFGGYSEANRAPTPAELACSDPERPCLLENFLAADPPLKQVVSRTGEIGLRGMLFAPSFGGKLDWNVVGYFTENTDDIIAVASPIQGRGFFQNFGKTRRQGVDLGLTYSDNRFKAYAGYGFVDATYQSSGELSSPNNPSGVTCSAPDAEPDAVCVNVRPGDKISGVPQHRFKVGASYFVTPQWNVGADLVAVGEQFFRGDETNQNAKLDAYTVVNLYTSYDISPNVQLYGRVNNVFDERYNLFGTYFNPGDVENRALTDPRTVVPGAPVSAYGGLKMRF